MLLLTKVGTLKLHSIWPSNEKALFSFVVMKQNAIACRYRFSTEELRNGLRACRNTSGKRWLLIFPIIIVLILVLTAHKRQDLLVQLGITIACCIAYYFIIRHRIRGSLWRDQDVAYVLDETGYNFEAPSIRSRVEWPRVTSAHEVSTGFIFYIGRRKRTYIWLPKHGFSSPEDIDRCRALIQEHIKDFRGLSS